MVNLPKATPFLSNPTYQWFAKNSWKVINKYSFHSISLNVISVAQQIFNFVTFLLDQKSNQKNQGCVKILRFCLVVPAETEKTRPWSCSSALRLIVSHRAQTLFRFYRLHDRKIGNGYWACRSITRPVRALCLAVFYLYILCLHASLKYKPVHNS